MDIMLYRNTTTSTPQMTVFRITTATEEVGTVEFIQHAGHVTWTLPVWFAIPDAALWLALGQAYAAAGREQGVGAMRAWLPPTSNGSARDWGWGMTYRWLQATTYAVATQPLLPLRYPSSADSVELAHLAYTAQATTAVGAETTLGATFDAMFALWSGGWGTPLEACSCVADTGQRSVGAALTTLYGATPLLPFVAANALSVATELLLTVLDALNSFQYPMVNLLLCPQSPLLPIAEAMGFVELGDVAQVVIGI